MKWYLETERICLRPIDKSDGENLHYLNADPDVMRFLSEEHKTLEEACEVALKVEVFNQSYDNKLGLFAAVEKKSNSFIGWFILRPNRANLKDLQNLEIGYRLMKKFWGKGYGTEVSLALMEKAKIDFKVKRVYADALIGNTSSIGIMKKIGLQLEKEYVEVISGKEERVVLYSKEF